MSETNTDYSKCTITNIRRGKEKRSKFIYAELRDEKGEILINATLDYIVRALSESIPEQLEACDNYLCKNHTKPHRGNCEE